MSFLFVEIYYFMDDIFLYFPIGLIHFDILLNIPPSTGAKHLRLGYVIKFSAAVS